MYKLFSTSNLKYKKNFKFIIHSKIKSKFNNCFLIKSIFIIFYTKKKEKKIKK